MTGKYNAYILQLDGALKVRPAVASIDKDVHAQFTIRNLTGHTATLRLKPPMPPHVPAPLSGHVPDLPSKQAQSPHDPPPLPAVVIHPGDVGSINVADVASGLYPYEVTFDLADGGVVHAAGESDPVVIVDP